jgi:hypothetical protein
MRGLELLLFGAMFATIATGAVFGTSAAIGKLNPTRLKECTALLQGLSASQALLPMDERVDSASGNRYPIYEGLNGDFKNAFLDVEYAVWDPNWEGSTEKSWVGPGRFDYTRYYYHPAEDGSLPSTYYVDYADDHAVNPDGSPRLREYGYLRTFDTGYFTDIPLVFELDEHDYREDKERIEKVFGGDGAEFSFHNILTLYEIRTTWAHNVETTGRADRVIVGDLVRELLGNDSSHLRSSVFARLPLTHDGKHRVVYTIVRWVDEA